MTVAKQRGCKLKGNRLAGKSSLYCCCSFFMAWLASSVCSSYFVHWLYCLQI